MTKAELVKAVCNRAEINQTEFQHGFETMVEVMKEELSKGNEIFVRGFGTFHNVKRQQKTARNISTGEPVIIPAHYEPIFKACNELKDSVSKNVYCDNKIK